MNYISEYISNCIFIVTVTITAANFTGQLPRASKNTLLCNCQWEFLFGKFLRNHIVVLGLCRVPEVSIEARKFIWVITKSHCLSWIQENQTNTFHEKTQVHPKCKPLSSMVLNIHSKFKIIFTVVSHASYFRRARKINKIWQSNKREISLLFCRITSECSNDYFFLYIMVKSPKSYARDVHRRPDLASFLFQAN